jgi:hypothetical protein
MTCNFKHIGDELYCVTPADPSFAPLISADCLVDGQRRRFTVDQDYRRVLIPGPRIEDGQHEVEEVK